MGDLWLLIPAGGGLGLLVALYLMRNVLGREQGPQEMATVAAAIREGAYAFLRRQYTTIYGLAIVVAVLLFFTPEGYHTSIAFLSGAIASGLAGFIGMYTSVNANLRTAAAARRSLNDALVVSFRGGAVTGLAVTALSLLGVAGLFYAYGGVQNPTGAPLMIVGFGFGASFVALFAQLGGGIYTKAADVGADLVGKVEAGIPEDDPRNPAVVADLVGDNVGDCAGRGADLFESTAAENIGAMILGIALYPVLGVGGIIFPLVARAAGIISSLVGIFSVRTREDRDPMEGLNRGYFITVILNAVLLWWVSKTLLSAPGVKYMHYYLAAMIGLLTSVLYVYITQYYTSYSYRPVREIAEASRTGPATNIISGVAVGMESTALPAVVISLAIIGAYYLGATSGLPHGGLYGTAVATMGMLSTAAYILAMDTFGPITDNAGGIVEMSDAPEEVRRRTDRLDATGNTTKALTKGYAIGSAALATFLLFSAYTDAVRLAKGIEGPFPVDIGKPEVFVAGLIGATLVFLFSSTAIRAVGKAAQVVIMEVRRQFREIPGILEGKQKPHYGEAVDIVTAGALKQMVLPGLLAVVTPIVVGLALGSEAAGGFLMVATITGILVALFLNNGGGAWDNAKKYIETGQLGGKGSDAHKASVVGDTVGDPFKDTAGPSLHVLIKLLSTITLVLAGLFVMRG